MAAVAHPYLEPSIATILIQSSFILLLNLLEWFLDRYVYCGLLGQILLGTAWGTPGAGWLAPAFEDAVAQLGYLGLLLIVFEGGLQSSVAHLRAHLLRSAAVALTGVALPVGISFVLLPVANATRIQSFAAGAALASTSLGTTITVLRASGFQHTRLGTVLTSAALLDDVVGLVMVQLVQNIGRSSEDQIVAAVLRPLGTSLGLTVAVFLLCKFVVLPGTRWFFRQYPKRSTTLQVAVILQTAALIALVAAASYAGCSNLLAAYLVGASVSWWYDTFHAQMSGTESVEHAVPSRELSAAQEPAVQSHGSRSMPPHAESTPPPAAEPQVPLAPSRSANLSSRRAEPSMLSGPPNSADMYHCYFAETVRRFLKPCFFASIGFALPIRSMFLGSVVWRGLVYAALMALGKLATGVWLVQVSFSFPVDKPPTVSAPVPRSWYPALLLGTAMIARGEIGFLIAALAQHQGLYGPPQDASLFLIVNWAIFVCTAVGPLMTGLLARRVRTRDERRPSQDPREGPLGFWGPG